MPNGVSYYARKLQRARDEIEHMQVIIDRVALIRLDLEVENRRLCTEHGVLRDALQCCVDYFDGLRVNGIDDEVEAATYAAEAARKALIPVSDIRSDIDPTGTATGIPADDRQTVWPEGATPCSSCSEPAVINIEGVLHCLCCGAPADERRKARKEFEDYYYGDDTSADPVQD